MAVVPLSKACRLGGEAKPCREFNRRTKSRDGFQAHCKACGRVALDAADARAKAEREARRAPAPPAHEYDYMVRCIESRAKEIVDYTRLGRASYESKASVA